MKVKSKRVNKRCIISGILLFFIVVLLALSFISKKNWIAKVNDNVIQEKEFNQILINEYKAETYNYFGKKYKAKVEKDFWNKNFNGEIPIEYAKQNTLNKCIEIKLLQSLMKEYGIVKETDYDFFLKEFKKENKNREEDIKKGKVVYGPSKFKEYEYFNYLFSNNVLKLKEELWNKKFHISDDDLKKHYEKVKGTNVSESDFNNVKDNIRKLYTEEKLSELLKNMKERAKVELNKGLYTKVQFKN